MAALDNDPTSTFAYCRSHRVCEDGQQDGFADFYLPKENPSQWNSGFLRQRV